MSRRSLSSPFLSGSQALSAGFARGLSSIRIPGDGSLTASLPILPSPLTSCTRAPSSWSPPVRRRASPLTPGTASTTRNPTRTRRRIRRFSRLRRVRRRRRCRVSPTPRERSSRTCARAARRPPCRSSGTDRERICPPRRTSPRSARRRRYERPNVICVRSFVPKEKKSAPDAASSPATSAARVSRSSAQSRTG